MSVSPRCIALALSLLAVPAVRADTRTLFWRSLHVEATLQGSGALRVTERHTMVFDGAWNGGERSFRLGRGQQIHDLSIKRVDRQSGREVSLSEASPSALGLDQYALMNGSTLRWRNRRSTDPPFRNEELIYSIAYTLRNVVDKEGDEYLLDHDFAFAERPGVIEEYSVRLDLDPVWEPGPDSPTSIERTAIPPGQGVIVHVPLTYLGEGQPEFVQTASASPEPQAVDSESAVAPEPAPRSIATVPLKVAASALFLLALVVGGFRFFRAEKAAGRFDAEPVVSRAWLQQNIFIHRPEVLGAAWDNTTGQAEVAALIAVMVAEGKIQNLMDGSRPRLKLLVPRESLADYERGFVDCMFVSGDEIDPDALRKHYAQTGFDPAATLRSPLKRAARQLTGSRSGAGMYVFGCILILALPFFGAFGAIFDDARLLVLWVVALATTVFSLGLAAVYRSQVNGPGFAAALPVPTVIVAAAAVALAYTVPAVITFLILALISLLIVATAARWPGTAEELRNLKNIRLARKFFSDLLRRKDPSVEEFWVPYLLAFGLGRELDQWFVAAPRSERTVRSDPDPFGGSATSGVSTGRNSSAPRAGPVFLDGGGSSFGGAGAGGGWGAAIQSFAAAVPAPAPASRGDWGSRSSSSSSSSWSSSSSSSSGSGSSSSSSSGGSRSGGGGGGGW